MIMMINPNSVSSPNFTGGAAILMKICTAGGAAFGAFIGGSAGTGAAPGPGTAGGAKIGAEIGAGVGAATGVGLIALANHLGIKL